MFQLGTRLAEFGVLGGFGGAADAEVGGEEGTGCLEGIEDFAVSLLVGSK